MSDKKSIPSVCNIPSEADYSGVTIIELSPQPTMSDYRAAMALADDEAERRLGEYMLLSWYDRDRDFEAPQHTSECHANSPIPGYVTTPSIAMLR